MGAIRLSDLPNYTYDDYSQWEGKWELIHGVPYAMSPSPVFEHQELSGRIYTELSRTLQKCRNCKSIFALDWKVNEHTTVCPDNMVVCSPLKSRHYIEKAPSIIFEILSPSTMKKDRTQKYELYEENGVLYYCIVEPAGMFAEVYMLEEGRYTLKGEFKTGSFDFQLDECEISFDFETLFKFEDEAE